MTLHVHIFLKSEYMQEGHSIHLFVTTLIVSAAIIPIEVDIAIAAEIGVASEISVEAISATTAVGIVYPASDFLHEFVRSLLEFLEIDRFIRFEQIVEVGRIHGFVAVRESIRHVVHVPVRLH